jgi:transposase
MEINSVGFSASESAATSVAKADGFDRPGVPANARANIERLNANKPLANVEPETILDRLYGGASVKEVAAEYGVSHAAMYAYLMRRCPEQWLAISTGKSLERLENAEAGMDEADDALKVSKARESHRMGAWTLERVARAFFGDTKNQAAVTVNVVIDRSGGETIIEGEKA